MEHPRFRPTSWTVLGPAEQKIPAEPSKQHSSYPPAQAVRSILRERRRRDQFFSAYLFGEPAWDFLLELYLAEIEQQRRSISCLCRKCHVPTTTALRWITTLSEEGLVTREADRLDSRRVFISLSRAGVEAMTEYFGEARAVRVLSPVASSIPAEQANSGVCSLDGSAQPPVGSNLPE